MFSGRCILKCLRLIDLREAAAAAQAAVLRLARLKAAPAAPFNRPGKGKEYEGRGRGYCTGMRVEAMTGRLLAATTAAEKNFSGSRLTNL